MDGVMQAASPQQEDGAIIGAYRHAMRRQMTGVAIITTMVNGQRHGMTANALMSLSMDPPSLAVCIKKTASMHDPVLSAQAFCVNLLAAQQKEVAAAFSGKLDGEARFAVGDWQSGYRDIPHLPGALSNIFCDVAGFMPWATHTLLCGRVADVSLGLGSSVLFYWNGQYGSMAAR